MVKLPYRSNYKVLSLKDNSIEFLAYDQIDNAPEERKEVLPSIPVTLSIRLTNVTMLTWTAPTTLTMLKT